MFFFDLDGPILNVTERYYRVYSNIMIDAAYETIGKEEYWDAKRWKTSEIEILRRTGAETFYEQYYEKRLSLIESDYFLSFDSLQKGAIQVLEKFSRENKLILVTLRKSSSQLDQELSNLDLKKYFSYVLRSGRDFKPRWKIKYNLIKRLLQDSYDSNHVVIGDTETDIIAGNELGLKTIAVLNGIRTKELLLKSNPDFICNSIEDLLNLEWIDLIGKTN